MPWAVNMKGTVYGNMPWTVNMKGTVYRSMPWTVNMKGTVYGNRLPRGTQVRKGWEPLVEDYGLNSAVF